MSEIHRVLKPGGWAIMQIPFFSPIPEVTFEDHSIKDKRERERIFGQDDHVRKYGMDYTKRIERAGLKATENRFVFGLSKERVVRNGLAAREVIFVGEKFLV
jgi:hypothetical protein